VNPKRTRDFPSSQFDFIDFPHLLAPKSRQKKKRLKQVLDSFKLFLLTSMCCLFFFRHALPSAGLSNLLSLVGLDLIEILLDATRGWQSEFSPLHFRSLFHSLDFVPILCYCISRE
jgi:hypothetical protein